MAISNILPTVNEASPLIAAWGNIVVVIGLPGYPVTQVNPVLPDIELVKPEHDGTEENAAGKTHVPIIVL
jgi:hypothetical protein